MTFEQLESRINKNVSKIVKDTAMEFNADIVTAWPVDTGFSKSQWQIKDISNFQWDVVNSAGYSGVLFQGRIGNRGSTQLEAGGYPILEEARIKMKKKLKREVL